MEYYAGDYQIMATIHEDREHPHIHFIMNSVNYNDGSKYLGTKKDYYEYLTHLSSITKDYEINVIAAAD